MPIRHEVLRVYETGSLTVIGFGETETIDQSDVAECREEIRELVKLHGCQVLAFDLTDVEYIPSVMLGMMASLTRSGLEVHLYNISPDVREVLEATHLASLFTIHEHVL
jgi:anti-sigma B factor antagonist